MSFYVRQGELPQKKHTTFFKADKKSLYREELVSSRGFSGIFSTLYHLYRPTAVRQIDEVKSETAEIWEDAPLSCYHFRTENPKIDKSAFQGRVTLLTNNQVSISVATAGKKTNHFFKNAAAHELMFVHHGRGQCHSEYGTLQLVEGDYLVMPKGTIYQLAFQKPDAVKLYIVESAAPFEIPPTFRNEYGQLQEHAPYSERDFKAPALQPPVDKQDEQLLEIKNGSRRCQYQLDHHPFDVIGWDGYRYPFTFNINNYAPIVGKIHQPPPVHLLFTTPNFVVCNFVPRLLDFDPQAIPAPYNHSNTDCDEVLYYVNGDFTSRKGIGEESLTLHPMGVPHGPHPGKVEDSIAKKETEEYAIMVDTFAPLKLTRSAQAAMVKEYHRSWL